MRIEQKEKSRCTELLCSLLGYSRQAYYKSIKAYQSKRFEACTLITAIEEVRKDQPRLAGDKVLLKLAEFKRLHGIKIGRDALYDLMRANGLLVTRRNRGKPRTTFSFHRFHKYPNRIIGLTPTGPNQLWVSDITYIRLHRKFAYLSLVTDAYSRKIVGYELCKTLSANGCVAALKMAVSNNPVVSQDLLHHSDRGVQYCCNGYIKLLEKHQIGISMTQSGDPRDNAIAERVNGILKDELLEQRYDLYDQAQSAVSRAISLYNNERPHRSVAMLTPGQAHLRTGELKRHWKNYYKFRKEQEVTMEG
jgi:putative transposase